MKEKPTDIPAASSEPPAEVTETVSVAERSGLLQRYKPLSAGAMIDRYTVLERVGVGGMGQVYAAYDGKLDRKVALKVLRQGSTEYEARLVREAQAMARLSHPNVVAVYDTGVVEGRLFLTMEFVRGTTLRAWQGAKKRSVEEILAVYKEAGKGLSAAHAAGLVHRDFKPDNVLVTGDERVKVGDFGIARALDEAVPEARRTARELRSPPPVDAGEVTPSPSSPPPSVFPTSPSLDDPMTEEGALLGTPGYMAPEQYRGQAVDERTDQFAFAVSLYEALYGNKPFSARDEAGRPIAARDVAQAIESRAFTAVPDGARVPAHVRSVLLHALAAEPAARYASMRAMLAELARDPARQRRRALSGAAAAIAVSAVAVTAVRGASARQAKMCAATAQEANEAWNVEVAARAEEGLKATGVPYAEDTWRRTRAQLDAYVAGWSAAHRQTCEATRVHHTQDERVMTLRMTCLDQRKSEVKALAQVLAVADREVAAKALQAAMALTPVDVCSDVASLSAVAPEPTDPAKRGELRNLRVALAGIKANVSAGRFAEARKEAGPLLDRAKALGYAPVWAEALLFGAQARANSGASREECVAQASEAAAQADVGHADGTRAAAATWLMYWLLESGKIEQAERWSKVVQGALEHMDEHAALRAEWLRIVGRMRNAQGRYADAAASEREALDLGKAAGVSPEELVRLLRSLAQEEAALGHAEVAEQTITEAEELLVRTMGPDHPARIRVIAAHGYLSGLAGNYRAEVEHNRRAIALAERVAPQDETLVGLYGNSCASLTKLGDHQGALVLCEKALALGNKTFGPSGMWVTFAHIGMGNTLLGLGRYRDAEPHFALAIASFEKASTQANRGFSAALAGLGEAKLLGGDPRGAAPSLERAIAMNAAAADRPSDLEQTLAKERWFLAKARWASGVRDGSVVELTRAAAEGYRKVGKTAEAAEVDAWQAAHAR